MTVPVATAGRKQPGLVSSLPTWNRDKPNGASSTLHSASLHYIDVAIPTWATSNTSAKRLVLGTPASSPSYAVQVRRTETGTAIRKTTEIPHLEMAWYDQAGHFIRINLAIAFRPRQTHMEGKVGTAS